MNKQKFYTGYGLLSVVLMVLLMFSSLPAMAAKYELYIAGTQVTDANCNNLKDITGVTVAAGGVFKYDPTTKTLTMKGVTVSVGEHKNAIWNRDIEGLTIVVSGTNRLTTASFTLNCRVSTKLEGSGSLTLTSSDNKAIAANGTTITISNITLEATGIYGIAGYDGNKNETLIIKNATVTAKGKWAAINDFKTVTLEGCRIVAPAGAEWKAAEKAVVDAEGNKAKEVKIEPAAAKEYELYIAGTQVTDANCDDLSGINGVTVAAGGVFKYDPATKTLTMKGVSVSTNENVAIWNTGIEGLKIEVSGTNRLEAKLGGLAGSASTEIEGNGSLTAIGSSAGVYLNKAPLTISNITLEATGNWGIAGQFGVEILIIKNATVTAKGSEAAIGDLKTFTLEGCQIIAPEGAEWNDEKKAVVDAAEEVAKEVKIAPIKK